MKQCTVSPHHGAYETVCAWCEPDGYAIAEASITVNGRTMTGKAELYMPSESALASAYADWEAELDEVGVFGGPYERFLALVDAPKTAFACAAELAYKGSEYTGRVFTDPDDPELAELYGDLFASEMRATLKRLNPVPGLVNVTVGPCNFPPPPPRIAHLERQIAVATWASMGLEPLAYGFDANGSEVE
jgi:hypothetical protein